MRSRLKLEGKYWKLICIRSWEWWSGGATPMLAVVSSLTQLSLLSQSVDVWQSISQFETQFLPLQLFIQHQAGNPFIIVIPSTLTPSTNQQPAITIIISLQNRSWLLLASMSGLFKTVEAHLPNWNASQLRSSLQVIKPHQFHSIAAACFQRFSSSLYPSSTNVFIYFSVLTLFNVYLLNFCFFLLSPSNEKLWVKFCGWIWKMLPKTVIALSRFPGSPEIFNLKEAAVHFCFQVHRCQSEQLPHQYTLTSFLRLSSNSRHEIHENTPTLSHRP